MSTYIASPTDTFVYWSIQPFAASYSLVQRGRTVKIIRVPHRLTQVLAKARGISSKLCPDDLVEQVSELSQEDREALEREISKIIRAEVARRLGLAGAHAVAAEVTESFCGALGKNSTIRKI